MAGGWRSWTTSAMKRLSCGVGMRVLTRSPRMIASLSSRSTLRPLSAETVRTFGRSRSLLLTRARSWSRSASSIGAMSHLLRTSAVAQPAFIDSSAIRRSCAVTPSWASQMTSATSARSTARCERKVV